MTVEAICIALLGAITGLVYSFQYGFHILGGIISVIGLLFVLKSHISDSNADSFISLVVSFIGFSWSCRNIGYGMVAKILFSISTIALVTSLLTVVVV